MKLKTIAALFKRNKRLTIYTTIEGEQWLSNGVAMYSMRGMPKMTPEVILRIFDIPPDKHNDWICNESEMLTVIDYSDSMDGEAVIEPLKINIEWYGDNYWAFPDGRRIYTFNEDYIKPLLDEPDYLTYHKRETVGGGFVLACKIGFELKAIIAPAMLHDNEKYMEEIKNISALYIAMEREKIINAAYEMYGEQNNPPPNVDPDTGELLDDKSEFQQETLI